jgi:hypothetical protein
MDGIFICGTTLEVSISLGSYPRERLDDLVIVIPAILSHPSACMSGVWQARYLNSENGNDVFSDIGIAMRDGGVEHGVSLSRLICCLQLAGLPRKAFIFAS